MRFVDMWFQGQNAVIWILFSKRLQRGMTEVNYKQAQFCGIGHSGFFDIHEVLQNPEK